MDFKKVLRFLSQDFKKHNISYGLIGGIALGAHGIIRATVDIDFLVKKDDLSNVKSIMESHGYKPIYESENVSQYVSDVSPFGAVDFLHAFKAISLSMLERAQAHRVFGGELEISVLEPEDIIGLKVQALVNNPDRKELEYADIKRVLEKFRKTLDWKRLKEYFILFGLENIFDEYEKKYRSE
jgi:hypothetical protein